MFSFVYTLVHSDQKASEASRWCITALDAAYIGKLKRACLFLNEHV